MASVYISRTRTVSQSKGGPKNALILAGHLAASDKVEVL